jgi:hypothetical protein
MATLTATTSRRITTVWCLETINQLNRATHLHTDHVAAAVMCGVRVLSNSPRKVDQVAADDRRFIQVLNEVAEMLRGGGDQSCPGPR